MKKIKYLLNLLPLLPVFIASIYPPSDPDLGWHLKYGEYFLKTGKILRKNLFSSSMTNYHWANHSWGSDVIIYFVYNYFGFIGLSILGALIITATFYIFSKAFNLSFWEKALIFPLIIYFLQPVNVPSLRSQLFSYLFTGFLVYILARYKKNSKIIFLSVPLFILWANIHGGFVLGLLILFLWSVFYIFSKFIFSRNKEFSKKETIILIAIIFFSTVATLINPFGINVYKEIIDRVNNPWRIYIAEWSPFFNLSDLWWIQILVSNLILVGCLFMFLKGDFKKNLNFILISLLIFALSFFERRYAWTAYYLIIIIIKPIADFFKPDKKYITIFSIIIIFITLGILLIIKSPFDQYFSMSWINYCQKYLYCSTKSAQFLEKTKYKKPLLTLYNWGGWLIWNYPTIKPSIDGRMHLWKDNKGYSAFGDYYALEQNWKDIDKSDYNTVYVGTFKPIYNKMIELTKKGKWKMVYSDNVSGIFVKN